MTASIPGVAVGARAHAGKRTGPGPSRRVLAGTATLTRHVLRLDRVRIPVWVGAIAAITLFSAVSVSELYASPEQLASYVRLAQGNPTLIAISGPGIGFDSPNIGVVLVNETTIWVALSVAAMSVFLLARHTRAEEDAERADLVRAASVGRHAPLAAAVASVASANLLLGLVTFGGVVALGYPAVGALAYSLSFVACGLAFTAIAAVMAQVAASSRAMIGWSAALVGVSYGLRAVGDLGEGVASWLSPLGWPHQVRPWAGERWWVLGLSAVLAVVGVGVAVLLADRRDLGSGLMPQRLGRPAARRWLSGPAALALRLQRGSIVGWSVGLFTLGLVYGAVGRDVEQLFEDNPDLEAFIARSGGASLTDAYVAYTLVLGAMMVAGAAIAATLRLRFEERSGRAELMLAGALGRTAWALGTVVVTVAAAVVMLVVSGAGTGLGLALAIGDGSQIARCAAASLAHLPSVLVFVGLAVALVGLFPRAAVLAWAAFGAAVAVALFADPLRLPDAVRSVSPIEHGARLPAEPFELLPLVVMVGVAALLGVAGLVGLRRRDISTQ